ncbi:hypothetical protein [Anaerosacchariphilus polymeriproducens]|uniref:Uncharacterized protein n=1 Tax=Anaerosacchariphilus polymeriproducens TaxID=1812858 RepID=A0A371AY66_9FIRM|nr:hypothetical protein [Anaerosacchariphilus polymeriproducens]RDU24511.1 hypothetical protein DWV06_03340 [Anaerosacchariphilus polymeriproducens]
MSEIKNMFRISLYQMKQWTSHPKTYAVLISMFIFMHSKVWPVDNFIKMVNVKATPFIFPFFFSDQFLLMLMMLGIVVLFCDAPFFDKTQLFIAVRCGKKVWACGQVIYLFLASIIYFIIIYMMSIIMLLPNIVLENNWGKIWNTLSQTDAVVTAEIYLAFPYKIIVDYTPVEAVLIVFILGVLVSLFLGLLLFFINIYINKAVSISIAMGFILITTRVAFLPPIVKYFSPVSWMSLNLISKTAFGNELSVDKVIGILVIMIIILVILCVNGVNKRDLDIQNV